MWFLCALLSGCASSLGDVFAKRASFHLNSPVIAWSQRVTAACITIPVAFCVTGRLPHVDRAFCEIIGVVLALNTVSTLMYTRAMNLSEISRVTPILGLSPAVLVFTAPLITGERITRLAVLGLMLSVCGAYVVGAAGAKRGWLEPFRNLWHDPGARLMLGVTALWSVTGPCDAVAVRHIDVVWYPAIFNAGLALTLAPIAVWNPGFTNAFSPRGIRLALAIGFFIGLSHFCQATAFSLAGSAAHVSGVKRLQVVFTVLLGWRIYRERSIGLKLLGSAILTAGAIVILLGKP